MKENIKRLLAKLGYKVHGTRFVPRQLSCEENLRKIEFDDVVCRRMFDSGEEFNFVQIGAFDGVVNDPLQRYIATCGWHGVLVEPQLRAVSKLHELYCDNSRVVIMQAAVDIVKRQRTLFTVASENAPSWAGGLASFELQNILKHANLIPGLATMIREEIVDCVPFDDILKHVQGDRLDLLQIDTEGADAYILSIFPFDRIRPSIVHWEVKHLTIAQREECLGRLVTHGYRLAVSGDEDMMATII